MYEDNRKKKKKYNNLKKYITFDLKGSFLIATIIEILTILIIILIGKNLISYKIILYIALSVYGYLIVDNRKMLPAIIGCILAILLFFSLNFINILLSIYIIYQSYLYYKNNK